MQKENQIVRIAFCSVLLSCLVFYLAACGQKTNRSRSVYMLVDTSGTYAGELDKAQKIINYLLGVLHPGDSLAVARIDTGSFSEKDIIGKVIFDGRPSVANTQKRSFKKKIEDFVSSVKKSQYTDISGAVLQAVEHLNESGSAKKYILIFSDLKEDLAKGHIRDFEFELPGINIIALNVVKLSNDIKDPKQYLKRIDQWEAKVKRNGGHWEVINDLERLDNIFRTHL
ncbi:MAG: VWA domain-containing protein [Desulfobacteraceae bacterium]|nr:VWA domain-containing protein [Desulfobacteraceae bacterium]